MRAKRMEWLALVLVVSIVGCGSMVSKQNDDAKDERTFPYPYAAVQPAARASLRANGFEITGYEPGFLTGHRPNQMGLFVGSGGENVGVWMAEVGPGKTKVSVVTKLTMLGMAGQRDWNAEVLEGIQKQLAAQPPGS